MDKCINCKITIRSPIAGTSGLCWPCYRRWHKSSERAGFLHVKHGSITKAWKHHFNLWMRNEAKRRSVNVWKAE